MYLKMRKTQGKTAEWYLTHPIILKQKKKKKKQSHKVKKQFNSLFKALFKHPSHESKYANTDKPILLAKITGIMSPMKYHILQKTNFKDSFVIC